MLNFLTISIFVIRICITPAEHVSISAPQPFQNQWGRACKPAVGALLLSGLYFICKVSLLKIRFLFVAVLILGAEQFQT